MNDSLEDKKKDLPGTVEDLRNLLKFWKHHKIEIPEDDMKWVEKKLAEKNPSLNADEKLKVQYLIATGHVLPTDVFKDAIFDKANDESKKIVFTYQFNEDLEKALSEKD